MGNTTASGINAESIGGSEGTSSDAPSVVGYISSTASEASIRKAHELIIQVEEGCTKLRLFLPSPNHALLSTKTKPISIQTEFRDALQQANIGPVEDIQKVTVKGQVAHLLVRMHQPTADEFIRDLASLPRLRTITIHLPVQIPDFHSWYAQRIKPHLETMSVTAVSVGHNRIQIKGSNALEIHIYNSYGDSLERPEEDASNNMHHAVESFLDPFVKEALHLSTVHFLLLSDNFTGSQTFNAICNSSPGGNPSHYLTDLTLKRWQDPSGDFEMQSLLAGFTAPSEETRKRRRDDDQEEPTSGEDQKVKPVQAPMHSIQRLTMNDVQLRLADFELFTNMLKYNTSLQVCHLIDCTILYPENKEEEKDHINEVVFDILRQNNSLKKFSFKGINVEVQFTWGKEVFEADMDSDYPILCQILETENCNIESIDLGAHADRIPEEFSHALALNIFRFRPFLGKKPYNREHFRKTLIRAKEEDLDIDRDQHLVPCLFTMIQTNPVLLESFSP